MYCRQAPENQSIEEDSVADNLLQETENLRRSSLSMSKVDTKRKSTTMRRAFLKQTVLDSSCVKVNSWNLTNFGGISINSNCTLIYRFKDLRRWRDKGDKSWHRLQSTYFAEQEGIKEAGQGRERIFIKVSKTISLVLSSHLLIPDPGHHHWRHYDPAATRRQPGHHKLPHVARHREVFWLSKKIK